MNNCKCNKKYFTFSDKVDEITADLAGEITIVGATGTRTATIGAGKSAEE